MYVNNQAFIQHCVLQDHKIRKPMAMLWKNVQKQYPNNLYETFKELMSKVWGIWLQRKEESGKSFGKKKRGGGGKPVLLMLGLV